MGANMGKPAIEVDNVSMKFSLSREKVDSLKDYIFKTIKREIQYNEFWALKKYKFYRGKRRPCGNSGP